jgi:hypothetical protein
MTDTAAPSSGVEVEGSDRAELRRAATAMALSLSVAQIGELAALPGARVVHRVVTGPHGAELLDILWGTGVGMILGHWYSSRVSSLGHADEKADSPRWNDHAAEVIPVLIVCCLATVPVLLLSPAVATEGSIAVLALLVGALGYLAAVHAGRSKWAAFRVAGLVLATGAVVIVLKYRLTRS